MSKVFRLHNVQGDPNIVDWQKSREYGPLAISQIEDPDGASIDKEITSIPSPFARIDLVKTAFKEINSLVEEEVRRNPNVLASKIKDIMNQSTIYHKIISDTLDIAQIFFNIDRFKNYFEIIVWDKGNDLDESTPFGMTLKRFIDSDSRIDQATGRSPYNFDKMNRIYLLNYIGPDKPTQYCIVGATSPATLFFSSANRFPYIAKYVSFDLDKPFDDIYNTLYNRDFEFQKYLYIFRACYPGQFSQDFKEINDFLDNNYRCLPSSQQREIDGIQANDISQYLPIGVGINGQDRVDVLGVPFHKRSNVINWKSDFAIKSKKHVEGKMPLVLPTEKGNSYAHLVYTTSKWGTENKAPYEDSTPWKQRKLPIVNDDYPYLTIGDFLEDTIVSMPYDLNSDSFYHAEYKNERRSFLLPIKDTFFQFYDVEDLWNYVMPDGKKMFELSDGNADSVIAILRIPIQNGYIEYKQRYFILSEPRRNETSIDGAIIDKKKIGLGIMPLIKWPEDARKYYRIALFDKGQRDVRLMFYAGEKLLKEDKHVVRDPKQSAKECSKETYVLSENFDRIKVYVGDTPGLVVPKFIKHEANEVYTFAVDFGTTNTHIEYAKGSDTNNPVSFNISPEERQLHRLHKEYVDKDINGAFLHNFVPDVIGDENYSFPMRTVLSKWKNNFKDEISYAFAHANIPFLYEKGIFPYTYNQPCTELKWRGAGDDYLVKLYLENLFILMRNKVALNAGSLAETKIIWFYPASMEPAKFNNFNAYWQEFYEKYFGDSEGKVIAISESSAPHRYYRRHRAARSEVVTIDVGGGTTDVCVVENNEQKMLMSFLYASTAVFGDGGVGNDTRWDSESNGFVECYFDEFVNKLETVNNKQLADLSQALVDIKASTHKSSDIIAFLFSLSNNQRTKGNESLDFLRILSENSRFKYVFILFYGSILYYVAKAMKQNGLKRPLTLAFSGNGAKTLECLSRNGQTIGQFAKYIFDSVYASEGDDLQIIIESEPKKATSKGGIINQESQTPAQIRKIKYTLLGDDMSQSPVLATNMQYGDIAKNDKKVDEIVNSVSEFVDFLFELHDKNDDFFTNYLGAEASIIDKVKKICSNKTEMRQSLLHALSSKRDDAKIEETLFFYPLVAILHELAAQVQKL